MVEIFNSRLSSLKFRSKSLERLKGAYVLTIELTESMEIEIGKLGVFFFPCGSYTYTGSAMFGIYHRVKRHLRRKNRFRWHIDYLLEYGKIKEVVIFESKTKIECAVNQMISTAFRGKIVASGFGARDCRENCGSHLLGIQKDGFQSSLEKRLKQVLSDDFSLKVYVFSKEGC